MNSTTADLLGPSHPSHLRCRLHCRQVRVGPHDDADLGGSPGPEPRRRRCRGGFPKGGKAGRVQLPELGPGLFPAPGEEVDVPNL